MEIDRSKLLSADEHPGNAGLAFLAYPSSEVDADGLPIAREAKRFLAMLQEQGVRFGTWSRSDGDTTWAVVRPEDRELLTEAQAALERDGRIEAGYATHLSSRLMEPFSRTRIRRRRFTRVERLTALAFIVVSIVVLFWIGIADYDHSETATLTLLSMLIGLLFLAAMGLERQRLQRYVRQRGLLVCPRCYYSLQRLGEEGKCPECGQSFRTEAIIEFWRERQ